MKIHPLHRYKQFFVLYAYLLHSTHLNIDSLVVSVIERTKEIGVLRSLGARKQDVSSVFNAETLLIGFVAGLLGVFVAFTLCFPINLIIRNLAGPSLTMNLAILNPLHALILLLISMVLTFISGLIPASMAAKKDPVIALRTE